MMGFRQNRTEQNRIEQSHKLFDSIHSGRTDRKGKGNKYM